jgi:hypothetical protein
MKEEKRIANGRNVNNYRDLSLFYLFSARMSRYFSGFGPKKG